MSVILSGYQPIVYRVKQGKLDANGRPEKHDYLTVYRNARVAKGGYYVAADVMEYLKTFGGGMNEEGKAYIIPIRLLFDEPELNIRTHLACFDGRKIKQNSEYMTPFIKCKGNGQEAKRIMPNGEIKTIPCPGPDECYGAKYVSGGGNVVKLCKLQGVFDFELRGCTPFNGGIARYRTAGFNSASGLLGQLQYYHKALGILRGLPLCIELNKNTVQAADGKLYTFDSLILSVEGQDPMKVLAQAKKEEMELRESCGINMQAVADLYRGLYSEELKFEEDDTVEDTDEMPDSTGYDEYLSKTEKEMTIEEQQKEKAKATSDMMAQAKAASQAAAPQSEPEQYPPTSSAAKRVKVQKEAREADKEKYGAVPSDKDVNDVFPD